MIIFINIMNSIVIRTATKANTKDIPHNKLRDETSVAVSLGDNTQEEYTFGPGIGKIAIKILRFIRQSTS